MFNGKYEDFPDGINPDCEALAVKELEDLDGLMERVEEFLKTAKEILVFAEARTK